MENAIVLCSGGLDSVSAAYYVKKKFNPKELLLLYVDYDQRGKEEELFCVEKVAKELGAKVKVVPMQWLGGISTALLNSDKELPKVDMKDLENVEKEKKDIVSYWVPCRNSLFVFAALAHAESLFLSKGKVFDIVLGIKKEGQIAYKDSLPEFVSAMNAAAAFATNDNKSKIIAPLIEFDKDEIVKLGAELNIPYQFTYSCYAGSGIDEIPVHCGSCSNCRQRQAAFYWSNVKDPSKYLEKND